MHVAAEFDAAQEIERRVAFLANYLRSNGLKTYVLGISGGVDSTTAGRLAQLAVERLRAEQYDARFVAIRLPYGVQKDEADAQQALSFIRADENLTIDIKAAADAMLAALDNSGVRFTDDSQQDFVHGNIKARQRMIAQYAVGQRAGGRGDRHGSRGRIGDGIFHEVRRRRRRCAAAHRPEQTSCAGTVQSLGAHPNRVAHKVPTADLEMLRPQRPDEDAYGIPYDDIDDFLEGKPVSDAARETVLRFYDVTRHKRALPYTPFDWPIKTGGE